MRLVDKDALLEELKIAIDEFTVENTTDQAFLEGVVAARRIVKFMEEVKEA